MLVKEKISYNFRIAVQEGNFEEVYRLMHRSDSWKWIITKYDLFHQALLHKHFAIAKLFLRRGFKITNDNRRNESDNSALHTAVLYGDSEIVNIILKQSTVSMSVNKKGMTPLHLVAYRNYVNFDNGMTPEDFDQDSLSIINSLVKSGLDINTPVNSQDKDGYTVLHLAAECGNVKIIPLLIKNEAEINSKSRSGLTPLHVATIHGQIEVVELLLQLGAKATEDETYKSPLFWASEERVTKAFHITINGSQKTSSSVRKSVHENSKTPLYLATETGQVKIVEILLNHECKHNLLLDSKHVLSCLIYASGQGNLEMVKIFVDFYSKKSPKWKLRNFKEPFKAASIQGHEKIVKLLFTECLLEDSTDVDYLESVDRSRIRFLDFVCSVVAIREATGRYVSKEELKLVESVKSDYYYIKCKKELDKMKYRKVSNTVSVFHILSKNTRKLVDYARNESLMQNFKTIDIKKEFPCYSSILKKRVAEAQKRKILLVSGEQHLRSICRFNFPSLVIYEILNYINSSGLQNLKDTIQSSKKSLPFKFRL